LAYRAQNVANWVSTDATAAFSVELEEAATKVVWPVIADKLMTVSQWVASTKVRL
jgi:hypothetical protein